MLTSFSIEYGLGPLIFTMSVMHGIGYALIYACAISVVMRWFPERARGFFSSIAVGGYGFGSVLWNPLVTSFVNPDNVKPVPDPDDHDNA